MEVNIFHLKAVGFLKLTYNPTHTISYIDMQTSMFFISYSNNKQILFVQDSIPAGRIPPTWKPYVFKFQLPPLDVTPAGWWVGPLMKKFEQVSSDHR